MTTAKQILDKRNKDEKLIDTSKGIDNNPYPDSNNCTNTINKLNGIQYMVL